MDIRKLVSDSFNDRKKIDRSTSVNNNASSIKPSESETNSLRSDKISLSGSISVSDAELAQRVSSKLNSESLERVKQIKRQIDNGEYDVDAALSKITSKLAGELKSLDAMLLDINPSSEMKEIDTKSLLSKLDDSIYRTIAEKLLSDIRKI